MLNGDQPFAGAFQKGHGLLARDPLRRRRALKRLSFNLPSRPAFRFVYQYVLRGGFLDGSQGLHYCRLLARYEGFISEEIDEEVRWNSLKSKRS